MSDNERGSNSTHGGAELGEPVDVEGELRVVTEASVWLIRPTTYQRLPRREGPRAVCTAALADAVWHAHEGVWHLDDVHGTRYRILPTGRRPGSVGVVTGDVQAATSTFAARLDHGAARVDDPRMAPGTGES